MAHHPFPKWRYHQDGRSLVVKDPAEEAARAPDAAGWGDQPFRDDGPTLEAYVSAGYGAAGYPPQGYLAKKSPAWDQLQSERAIKSASMMPPAPPPAPAPVPEGIPEPPANDVTAGLEGTVEQVTALVGAMLSKDMLSQLRTAEAAGKNRKGVLAAIDAQLAK